MTIWKQIPSLPTGYEASDEGEIRGPSGHIRTQHLNAFSGVPFVTFTFRQRTYTHYVHKMVAQAFGLHVPPGMKIGRVDGNKQNCRLDNLRPMTQSEIIKASYARGRPWATNRRISRKEREKLQRRLRTMTQFTNVEAGAQLGVHHATISRWRSGK